MINDNTLFFVTALTLLTTYISLIVILKTIKVNKIWFVGLWLMFYPFILIGISYSFLLHESRKNKIELGFIDIAIGMAKLTYISIRYYPTFVMIAIEAFNSAEKNNLLKNEEAKKRQAQRVRKEKSYDLYGKLCYG